MEFPKKYKAPRVEDLAARSSVTWGVCEGGGSPSEENFCAAGPSASIYCDGGASAATSVCIGAGVSP